jgi:hypothetical protein
LKLKNLANPFYVLRRLDRIGPALRDEGRNLRLSLAAAGAPMTAYRRRLIEKRRRLEALRDECAGRRVFVIGNGPSLRVEDLEAIRGEITIASNKIYLLFDRTDWRPTYYTVADRVVAESNREAIDALPLTKLVERRMRSILDDGDGYLYYKLGPAGDDRGEPHRFSDDFARVVYGGYSVTYVNLQLAAHLGASEIVLLGVDFHFELPARREPDREFGQRLISDGEVNHFTPEYRRPGEVWTLPRLDLQRAAFAAAAEALGRRGVRAFNASRATRLEVFPRVELERVLGG